MIPRAFGERAPWSVGIEEELLILDAASLALVPRVDAVVAETGPVEGALKRELFASVVEAASPPSASVPDALAAIASLRRAAAAAASRLGLRIAAAGSHPFSRPEEQEIAPDPRYLEFAAHAGVSARRQGVCGLHVHVAMPSGEACHHVLEGVLPWLPLVLALSANSPYLAGEETGLASARAEVLALLPRSGAPPLFASYADWEGFVERFARLGVARDYTSYWWDARIHPRLGTLEIRMPDQPTRIELTGAFAALLQALCVVALARPPLRPDPARRGDYQQNRWAALRFGRAAQLVHPDGERAAGVPELAGELLALVEPAARDLGTLPLLEALDLERSEADAQLELGRRLGLRALCEELVLRSEP